MKDFREKLDPKNYRERLEGTIRSLEASERSLTLDQALDLAHYRMILKGIDEADAGNDPIAGLEAERDALREEVDALRKCPHQCGHDECELVIGSVQGENSRLRAELADLCTALHTQVHNDGQLAEALNSRSVALDEDNLALRAKVDHLRAMIEVLNDMIDPIQDEAIRVMDKARMIEAENTRLHRALDDALGVPWLDESYKKRIRSSAYGKVEFP